jgi:hypothetical protein
VNRGFYAFWRPFVGNGRTTIVLGNARVVTLDGKTRDDYVGVGEARSLGFLQSVLASASDTGAARLDVLTSIEVTSGSRRIGDDVIFLGGPTVNRPMRDTLARIKGVRPGDRDGLNSGYRFVVPQGVPESALARVSEDGRFGIEDVRTGELLGCGVRTDAALLVRARVKSGRGTRDVLICAGYGTQGGLGAIRALSTNSNVLAELRRRFEADGYAELVVRLDANGEVTVHDFETAADAK